MGNTLYLECNSGISGDMVVAALLDLGASEEELRKVLSSLPLSGYQIEVSRVKKSGLDCCDFNVILDEAMDNHDHDMDYLYGHLGNGDRDKGYPGHGRGHDAGCDHIHLEDHDHHDHHDHQDHHGHHDHRGIREVREILACGQMTDGARILAHRIFGIIAQAEAEAHGTTVEKVHFHEVGAVDSIVDIVAASVCLDDLHITDTIITGINEGSGTVRCAHGILSVPVPAVASIVKDHRLPIRMTGRQGELITPTGAAIAAAICTSHCLPDPVIFEKTGMGAGKRAYEIPSILRAFLLASEDVGKEKQDQANQDSRKDLIWKLETNLDDCTGEDLGCTMEKLFQAGARDVYYTPVFMKKNRPGVLLSVLCKEEDIARMEEIIFQETTTIGIRRCPYERTILPRRKEVLQLECGNVEVKVCSLPDGSERIYPEYESVLRLSQALGISRREIQSEILRLTH